MSRTIALLRLDLRTVLRDPMLVLFAVLPLAMAVGLRFGFPALAALVAEDLDLAPHAPLATGFLLFFAPVMTGWLTGFLLLEERESRVLAAIAVTPLGKTGFLAYRLLAPTALAFLLALALPPLAGLATLPPLRALALAVTAALEAPMMAMLLAAFAENKVEGMAVGKLAGLLFLAPFAPLLVAPPWHLLAAVAPPWWVVELVRAREASVGEFAALAAGGLLVHALALLALQRRFRARVG